MMALQEQYLTDREGNRVKVVLEVKYHGLKAVASNSLYGKMVPELWQTASKLDSLKIRQPQN